MNARSVPFAAVLLAAACLVAAEPKTYHEAYTPKTLLEWRDARDGKVSICFAVAKTTFSAKETIAVRCGIRNNTDKSLTMLRPFGDDFYSLSTGLAILGPDGEIPYRGAIKDYVLGTSSFVELPAHTVTEETLELPPDLFPDLGKAGLYTIGYQYLSGGHPEKTAPENLWQGKIKGASLSILVR